LVWCNLLVPTSFSKEPEFLDRLLVQCQIRSYGKSYNMGHDVTTHCASFDRSRVPGVEGVFALFQCLQLTPLPDPSGQHQKPTRTTNCPPPPLRRATGSQRLHSFQPHLLGLPEQQNNWKGYPQHGLSVNFANELYKTTLGQIDKTRHYRYKILTGNH